MAKIAIIGGGVFGSSSAYYLALAGAASDVIVIEPDPTYDFAATPRATGGIRQLFTVPETPAWRSTGTRSTANSKP
jgi:FAD-dependent oxidoreductase domain-containing protein 1